MDDRITQQIKDWLETPKEQRNIPAGAMLLLKINRNQVLYNNIIKKPQQQHDKLEYELNKQLKWRLEQVTHEQVVQMENKVEQIAAKRALSTDENPAKEFKAGKREDHDNLPQEVQALYVENKSILQRMRDLHAQLRIIQSGKPGYTCKDSDKYPFLKELIKLDQQYRDNWAAYDGFDVKTAETIEKTDSRADNRKALAIINLNKKKYQANPNEELREKLAAAYAKVTNPKPKLVEELKEMGIIE